MGNIDLIIRRLQKLTQEHPELSVSELLAEVLPDYRTPEALLLFKEQLENMSKDSQSVCKTVFSLPHKCLKFGGKKYLKLRLRKQGWIWKRIQNCFAEIREMLNKV